jgi:hypothetical protein
MFAGARIDGERAAIAREARIGENFRPVTDDPRDRAARRRNRIQRGARALDRNKTNGARILPAQRHHAALVIVGRDVSGTARNGRDEDALREWIVERRRSHERQVGPIR